MTNEEALQLAPGIYRIIWDDAHSDSIGVVIGPRGFGEQRPLASDRSVRPTGAWNLTNPWPRVERLEPLVICDSPNQCEVRKNLVQLSTKGPRLALADRIGETALPTIRDLFLEGRDQEALEVLAVELGLVQLASRGGPFRDLKVGDPVVVVSYGRIIRGSSGHGTCYEVGLFSEGLGYGTTYGSSNPRVAWFEANEIRYSHPPSDVHARMPISEREAEHEYQHVASHRPPTKLSRALEAFETLTDSERMAVMQQCCRNCGQMGHSCDCAKRATEGTF